MVKLCLTIIILNAIFSAEEFADNIHTPTMLKNTSSFTSSRNYIIYNDIFKKCQLLEDILTKKYERHIWNIHNIDFPWEKISKTHALCLIENTIDEEFIRKLDILSTQADQEDQQKINNFLSNFDICKRKTYTLSSRELCKLIDDISTIKSIIFLKILFEI